MAKKKPIEIEKKEPEFTKEALVNSNRFRHERDLVTALLKDGEIYSVEAVESMIAEYKKGTVK